MSSDLRSRLVALSRQLRKYGFEVEAFELDPPATPTEIRQAETLLGFALPPRLRELLSGVAAHFEMHWGPGDDLEVGHRDFCGFGQMNWDVAKLVDNLEQARSWGQSAGPKDPWNRTLPVVDFQDGDYLAVELGETERVLLLWHEGGEDHGRVLAPDFPSLVESWVQAGFDRSFLLLGDSALRDPKQLAAWQEWICSLDEA
ncbi:MAG: SMI1/KNR4 family protein [Verrucomicrobia bacterium]|nr:SMI1/KNR4 family protein [Verrucomicrobiota bacterium]